MKDPLNLKQYVRTVDDFPIDGIVFRDITSLIETPKAFVKTCNELTKITKELMQILLLVLKAEDLYLQELLQEIYLCICIS